MLYRQTSQEHYDSEVFRVSQILISQGATKSQRKTEPEIFSLHDNWPQTLYFCSSHRIQNIARIWYLICLPKQAFNFTCKVCISALKSQSTSHHQIIIPHLLFAYQLKNTLAKWLNPKHIQMYISKKGMKHYFQNIATVSLQFFVPLIFVYSH